MIHHMVTRVALVITLQGCTSWQVAGVAPAAEATGQKPQRVRVTRIDGSQVVLEQARVTPAGVYGRWERTPAAIDAAEIRDIAVRREAPSRTIALIVGVLGVAGAAGALALGAGDHPRNLR